MEKMTVVGKGLPRVDAVNKVTGKAKYSMDIRLNNVLYGKVKRSRLPHARLLEVDTSKAEKLGGVKVVVTADDTPDVRFGKFVRDEMVFARGKVRFVGEPIAAVAAVDEETAEKAIELIEVEYEELPAVLDPEKAMRPDSPVIHEDISKYQAKFKADKYGNVCSHTVIEKGDIEEAFGKADFIFEDIFKTPSVHQSYLEPQSVIADIDNIGKITMWTGTRVPFQLRQRLSEAFQVPMTKIRIQSVYTGGVFGGKEPVVPCICFLLAQKAEQPVSLELTREEEFIATSPRHPSLITLKTGVMNDGTLVARYIRMVLDTGAYATYGPDVLALAVTYGIGPYVIPNVKLDGYCVYTNKEPFGAFRGYGGPQHNFAGESQMGIIAAELGLDPLEFRLKNCYDKDGSELVTGQKLYRNAVKETLKKIPSAISRIKTGSDDGKLKRGQGVACTLQLSGLLQSGAFVKINDDGTVMLLTGAVDVGQGSDTVLSQIVAEELGMNLENISIIAGDTDITPFDFGSVASSDTRTSGTAVMLAAVDARQQLLTLASEKLATDVDDLNISNNRVYVKASPERNVTIQELSMTALFRQGGPILGSGIFLESEGPIINERCHGFPYTKGFPTFMSTSNFADLKVDTETGQVTLLSIVVAHDLGCCINPMSAEGQVEGSIGQGMGFALMEEIRFDNGVVLNPNFVDYKIPTSMDMPDIISKFVEEPDLTGVYGAKGIGEGALIPTASAIANAVYDAVEVRIKEPPITAEKILKGLKEKGKPKVNKKEE